MIVIRGSVRYSLTQSRKEEKKFSFAKLNVRSIAILVLYTRSV